jgi:pilus assembly protein CpaC
MFGASKGAVINSLTIKGKDQVMLRVTLVEVARSVLKQFGIKTEGAGRRWTSAAPRPSRSAPRPRLRQRIAGSLSGGNNNLGATLNAFERAGVSRILAEPPSWPSRARAPPSRRAARCRFPTSQDCTTVGNVRSCTTSTTFKPYGISLNFTPVVMSENRISLRVNTEVTELDYENAVRNGEVNVPGVKVRRSATSVELPSGATMMTAGLLSQTMGHAVSGVPGLMSLPILGLPLPVPGLPAPRDGAHDPGDPLHRQGHGALPGGPPDDGFVSPTTRRPSCWGA